jgi:DNA helicase-2/ATP-dependent DNA helicase PcrA
MQPSKYQSAVYEAVRAGTPAIVVSAVAGSGKTTTLVSLLEHIQAGKSIMYLTFGRDANIHLDGKINGQILKMLRANYTDIPNVECRTVHSLGNSALVAAGIKGDPGKGSNKYMKMARALISAEEIKLENAGSLAAQKFNYQLAQNLRKLVDMVRLTLSLPLVPVAGTTETNLRHLISRFEIDILPEDEDVWPFVLQAVPAMLRLGVEKAKTAKEIDFTDQIWLPSSQALNLYPQQFDVVLVDEAQDLSPCQRELALRACKPSGQKIFVGDRNQSIFGFAGASLRSIDEIVEATRAVELPLSICYRCPKVVVDEARRVGPDYTQIEASEWAAEGTLEYTTPDKISTMVRPGDLILCRLTAPLVEKCLELLRDGKRANVRGRDLGAQFTAMIEQIQKFVGSKVSESELMFNMNERVREYERRQIEIMSLNLDENEMKIATLQDKVDTLLALYEAYVSLNTGSSLKGFQAYITDFFKEDLGAQIILSTGHRAKGLEYPRVFILGYDKLPHPRAKTPEAIKQELNLQYVMVTRCLHDPKIEGSGTLFLVVSHIPEPIEEQPALFGLLDELEAELSTPVMTETEEEVPARKRGRTPGQTEPTKKKDFRFPVRLLEALKAVADEDGMSDTELIVSMLKSDKRIQRKLMDEESPDMDITEQNIKRIEQYAMDCAIGEGKAKERIVELEEKLKRYDESEKPS